MNEVWVIAEQRLGRLMSVSLELLSKANELAHTLKTKSGVVLMGDNVQAAADELAYYADKVHVMDDPKLRLYQSAIYAELITQLIRAYKPDIVLIGSTSLGQDLAPRVAAKLGTGLTAHCADLWIAHEDREKPQLVQVVPGWGGNLMVNITCPAHRPQMATVRPGILTKCTRRGRKGKIYTPALEIKADPNIETLEITEESPPEMPLAEAETVVAGGWGLASAYGFTMVEDLAKVLGGSVAGTRPAADGGWITKQRMVGQSGVTVKPKLFISVGASGAPQFTIGFLNARVVLAIDQNPNAPIFEMADIGLVGDLRQIVPCLVAALQESTLCGTKNEV